MRFAVPVFFIRAEGLRPAVSAMFCVVTKGIKAYCKHLVSVWNHRHPCMITHTVRNIEHCTPMHCIGGVDLTMSTLLLPVQAEPLPLQLLPVLAEQLRL